MPRYHVVMCDVTGEIEGSIVRARHPVHAILQHKWIANTYLPSFIQERFAAEEEEQCKHNIHTFTSWRILCVNLDEETMKDLNGGDLSVSSLTPLN